MWHPAVLAEKYDRNYRPYFLGELWCGLNQYLECNRFCQNSGNTAVCVVSPQWFTVVLAIPLPFQQSLIRSADSFINHHQDAVSQYAKRLLQQVSKCRLSRVVNEKFLKERKISRFDQS